MSGNINNDFALNASDGTLLANKPLDYETNSLYIIIVSVSDMNGGKGGYEDLAAVQINVQVYIPFFYFLFPFGWPVWC